MNVIANPINVINQIDKAINALEYAIDYANGNDKLVECLRQYCRELTRIRDNYVGVDD